MQKEVIMSKEICKKTCKTKIGGQALLEGVMMRGPEVEAMAVRLPDGTIDLEQWDLPKAKWYKKVPFVRGPVNFIGSMIDGYKCISKSADKSMQGLEEEPSKFEKWLTEKFGEGEYKDVLGICKIATNQEIEEKNYSLTPGAYVGVAEAKDDGVDFHERMTEIHAELKRLNDEANVLMDEILKSWEELK